MQKIRKQNVSRGAGFWPRFPSAGRPPGTPRRRSRSGRPLVRRDHREQSERGPLQHILHRILRRTIRKTSISQTATARRRHRTGGGVQPERSNPPVPPPSPRTPPAKALLAKDVTSWRKEVEDGEYRIVLLTDDTLIPNYEGVVKRSGEMIGIRMGSVFYDFPGRTLEMAGAVGEGRILTASVACEEDFSSNPYRHLYHPDTGKASSSSASCPENPETPSETDDQGNPKRAGYGESGWRGTTGEDNRPAQGPRLSAGRSYCKKSARWRL